jgi:cyclohexyl-isocyanide hydratase
VSAEPKLTIQPTHSFADVRESPDVLFVPGGLRGTAACLEDPEILSFIRRVGASARFVTSVCTGSLVLGAAGLLRGYRATGYWPTLHLLPPLGASVGKERVVFDRNRITGGGITAGLDFGLIVAAAIRGEDWAKTIQLMLEYAPAPPFNAGTPETAGPAVKAVTERLLAQQMPLLEAAAMRAGRRLLP